ncbi:MAG TPA: hypothetical protein VMF08_21150, partial [Candidatus Sulfotelmatobacter sp.]|nr:hypothetical protein [Candidatus Sulfotelmatobacter sp.]
GISHSTGGTPYEQPGDISIASGDPISVEVNYSNGTLSLTMTDLYSLQTFSADLPVQLTTILGSDMAYVGFSGADGGATSTQTISEFEFTSVVPPVPLAVSPETGGSYRISWSAANPDYALETTTNLLGTWTAGPAPTESNGTNYITVTPTGTGAHFYRLVLGCE